MSNENSSSVYNGAASLQPTTWGYMLAARRWLVWAPDKQPFYVDGTPRRGTLDADEDRGRLATYDDACRAVQNSGGRFAGIGFALGPDGTGWHWQGIDLDKVPESGLADIANALPGYVERSPSGKGCHAIGYGQDFQTLSNKGTGIEAYSHGHYFTVTGQMIRDNFLTDLAPYVTGVLTPLHHARLPHGKGAAATHGAAPTQVPPATRAALRSALLHLRADDYAIWQRCGMALRELNDVGRGLWLEWSATSEKFNSAEAARKWDRDFKSAHSLTHTTVFHEATKAGWVNTASNAAQVPTAARGNGATRSLKLMSEADIDNAVPSEWIIKSVIPENSIGTLYGPSGTFKSFIALDALAHVANGWPWMGKRVKKVPCVYIPFEGKGGIPKRARAWREAMQWKHVRIEFDERLPLGFRMTLPKDTDSTRIVFVMEPLNLREAADRTRLVDALKAAGLTGCLLCIDTLAQASAGIDENSSAMGEILTAFQELQHELGCSVLIIHHTGKDESRGMRGWSGIRGAMDYSIECQRPDSNIPEGVIWLNKLKDEEDGKALSNFWMRRVVLDYDEDGDQVSSLVVEPPITDVHSLPNPEPSGGRDAAQDKADDEFVFEWLKKELTRGEYPTGRSLEGQRELQMKAEHPLTQKRLRDAISRLKAASRIVDSVDKAPHGSKFLRAVDTLKAETN